MSYHWIRYPSLPLLTVSQDVCKLLSVPAPQWPPPPKMSKPKTDTKASKPKARDPEETP